ncbi:TasA family protein [Halomicrobium salinisoli]|uniref:TasA family protein n=1 Tax=Halomicrobium salinisoli TaxID=2878391 RepID=UPI001CF06EE4|nr:TasA family protein [Halomicrobium salinisoli]
MEHDRIAVTRRRLLGGLGTVAGASAATGAGTMAAFSDSESSTVDGLRAGTLDLTTDSDGAGVTFLDVDGIAPGDRGAQSLTLGNGGSIEGVLEVDLDEWRSYESGDDAPGGGTLKNYLRIQLLVDGDTVAVDGRDWNDVQDLPENETLSSGTTIPPGGSATVAVKWHFDPPNTGNAKDAEGDSVEIDVTFRLVQSGGG